MSDLISREDAIKVFSQRARILQGEYGDLGGACSGAMKIIESLPSAEPERKKGMWLEKEVTTVGKCRIKELQSAKCSVCGRYHTTPFLYYFGDYNYCPSCGARMTR